MKKDIDDFAAELVPNDSTLTQHQWKSPGLHAGCTPFYSKDQRPHEISPTIDQYYHSKPLNEKDQSLEKGKLTQK